MTGRRMLDRMLTLVLACVATTGAARTQSPNPTAAPAARAPVSRTVPVVWVIGQSNACGAALGFWLNNRLTAGAHHHLAHQSGVRIWWPGSSRGRPQSAAGWETYQTGSTALVNNSSFWIAENRFGTEASLADAVRTQYGEAYVYKFALVARLDARANPSFSRGVNERDGLYGVMLQNWRAAEQSLLMQGLVPDIKGIIWIQGEGDTLATGQTDPLLYARDYALSLSRFITDLRNDLAPGGPPIPFVISQLHDQQLPRINWAAGGALVRAAQAQVATNDPWTVLCPVNGISLDPRDGQVHFDAQGYVDLGYRLFQSLQPMLR